MDRCARAERVESPLAEPLIAPDWRLRLADLLALPSPAELLAAGIRPVLVPFVGGLLSRMAEQTRGMFLSMADDRVDVAPDWLTKATFGLPGDKARERVFLAAIASALFGWLP